VFGALTREEGRELLKRAHVRRFQPAEVVFRRGDAGDGLYCVLTGSILIVVESTEGRELILNKQWPTRRRSCSTSAARTCWPSCRRERTPRSASSLCARAAATGHEPFAIDVQNAVHGRRNRCR
jgi:CRP-like cAMP-binding protein